MNRISLTLLLFFALITRSFSQVVFEPGYFITESNERIECLIRNMDWKNNPYEIEYKLSEASSEKIEGIDNILEFGINGEGILLLLIYFIISICSISYLTLVRYRYLFWEANLPSSKLDPLP